MNAGATYLSFFDGFSWSNAIRLGPSVSQAAEEFGRAVAIHEDIAFVGVLVWVDIV